MRASGVTTERSPQILVRKAFGLLSGQTGGRAGLGFGWNAKKACDQRFSLWGFGGLRALRIKEYDGGEVM